VYKDNYATREGSEEEDTEDEGHSPEWFVSRAGRFLRDLRKYVPPILQEGWFQ